MEQKIYIYGQSRRLQMVHTKSAKVCNCISNYISPIKDGASEFLPCFQACKNVHLLPLPCLACGLSEASVLFTPASVLASILL
jgi:hypothetical protein